MKKSIFSTSLLTLLFSFSLLSCKTTQTTTTPITVESYTSFLGITYGDTIDKVYKIFGEPTEIDQNDNYSFISVYYHYNSEHVLTFTYDKVTRKVEVTRLKSNLNPDATASLRYVGERQKDTKALFLGQSKKEILANFGNPGRVNAGNYEYSSSNFSLTFICYDFQDEKCSEIYLQWYHR